MLTLVKILNLPGSVWLVDLPGNGDNEVVQPYDYNEWFKIFVPMVKKFEHPIVVGHSFGAMMPLMLPELEDLLDGFVIMHSSPALWFTQSAKARQKFNIPDCPERQVFLNSPSQMTFQALMSAQVPTFFTPEAFEKGRAMFNAFPYPYHVAQTLLTILKNLPYEAKWIPQKVRTLIIGGERDYIHPHCLFSEDARLDRPNIKKIEIKGAGHWSWIEQPDVVKSLFEEFCKDLPSN